MSLSVEFLHYTYSTTVQYTVYMYMQYTHTPGSVEAKCNWYSKNSHAERAKILASLKFMKDSLLVGNILSNHKEPQTRFELEMCLSTHQCYMYTCTAALLLLSLL